MPTLAQEKIEPGSKCLNQAYLKPRNIATINNGRVESDTSFILSSPFFDSYLTDYLFGALPLKPGYRGQFRIGVPGAGLVIIKGLFQNKECFLNHNTVFYLNLIHNHVCIKML
jgi:hypothetical protein